MPTFHVVVLAIVQGLTEFLPISSSGHLALVPLLADWADQGPLIDVAVHVGSLLAVTVYMWRDVILLLRGGGDLLRWRASREARLAGLLLIASVPVFVAGFLLLQSGAVGSLRTIGVIAAANLIFALLLYVSDRRPTDRGVDDIGFGRAIAIGLAQALALVPGVSRSGVTMTAARFLGVERTEAARFSMLLAIPTILGAGAGAGYEIYRSGDLVLRETALIAAGLSFVTALLAIWGMMAWLRRMTFTPFVAYRVALSALLFALIWQAS